MMFAAVDIEIVVNLELLNKNCFVMPHKQYIEWLKIIGIMHDP